MNGRCNPNGVPSQRLALSAQVTRIEAWKLQFALLPSSFAAGAGIEQQHTQKWLERVWRITFRRFTARVSWRAILCFEATVFA